MILGKIKNKFNCWRSGNKPLLFCCGNEVNDELSRYKNGNPKYASRFICMRCMSENMLARGIQRQRQRERKHVKDLYCLRCGEITKCIEVRFCDSYDEIFEVAKIKRENYYIDDYESEVDNYVLQDRSAK